MFRAVLADGGIRDGNAQLGQFGLDAWTAPTRIVLPHPANQSDEVAVGEGSATAVP
jgi:hypothetical protein